MRLKDKVAIVTGGGRGIGAATAIRFASEGALVAVADVSPEAAKDVADQIINKGGKALDLTVDVSSKDSVSSMLENMR